MALCINVLTLCYNVNNNAAVIRAQICVQYIVNHVAYCMYWYSAIIVLHIHHVS